jgi:hypothetical protein
VGSKKPRTGHLVEELLHDVIVVKTDGQISQRALAVVVRRRLLLLFIQQRTRRKWNKTVFSYATALFVTPESVPRVLADPEGRKNPEMSPAALSQQTILSHDKLEQIKHDYRQVLDGDDPRMLSGSLFSRTVKSDMAGLFMDLWAELKEARKSNAAVSSVEAFKAPKGTPRGSQAPRCAQDERSEEQIEADYQALMQTQVSQAEIQTPDWIEAKVTARTQAKEARKEARKGHKYVCPRMKSGRTCNGLDCDGKGGSDFHHPPVCKDPSHCYVCGKRPDSCVLWHLQTTPNARGGSKGKFTRSGRNSNSNSSGNSNVNGSG